MTKIHLVILMFKQEYMTQKGQRVGYNIAKEIFDELQGLTNTTLISSGKHVVKVNALNTPIDIGRDDNSRHEWTVNFQIEVRDIGTNKKLVKKKERNGKHKSSS